MRMLALILILLIAAFPSAAEASRIKDLGTFQGARPNQLVGYGIVVGLAGTGDDNLEYATQGMTSIVARFGITLPPGVNPALRNSAAVLVTAELSPFAKPGQQFDITVSAVGRARSLRGGTLILTPLRGADGRIYAMAQGNLVVGGLGVSAQDGSQLTVNVPSTGRIAAGATVEREVAGNFATSDHLVFNLASSDLTTASIVAAAINRTMAQEVATAVDAVSVMIAAPPGAALRTELMSRIENIEVTPASAPARVIVNSRTGTIVINGAVRIDQAAVTHGRLTVVVSENPRIVQPAPFSDGRTAVEPDSSVEASETRSPMFLVGPTADLSDIVAAINRIGVGPSDLIAILEAMKQAGALRAELEII